jgi:hypothetical protein
MGCSYALLGRSRDPQPKSGWFASVFGSQARQLCSDISFYRSTENESKRAQRPGTQSARYINKVGDVRGLISCRR